MRRTWGWCPYSFLLLSLLVGLKAVPLNTGKDKEKIPQENLQGPPQNVVSFVGVLRINTRADTAVS